MILLHLGTSLSSAQTPNPNLKTYPPKTFSGTYPSSPQNIGIIQSGEGLMYFANGSGVLEFDGASWRMLKGTGDVYPRDFAIDSAGVIYVGGNNNIGFLKADSSGETRYNSLLHLLQEHDREFGLVYNVYSLGYSTFFFSRKQLMKYSDEGGIKVWKAKSKFLDLFVVNGSLYIEQENIGLMKVAGNELKLVFPSGNDFNDFRALNYFETLCPCHEATEYRISRDSLGRHFLFNGNDELLRIDARVSEFLNAQRGFIALKIPGDNIVVGTLSGGVVILDKKGELKQLVDKSEGLPENIVNALYLDNSDGLWIAHDIGLSRLQLNSPLELIGQNSGYTGIAVSILRYEGKLHIATTDGVYVEKTSSDFNGRIAFERIHEITNQAYSLLEKDNRLLAATINGIFEIKNGQARKITEGIAIELFASPLFEKTVFAGMNDGILPLEFDNESWKAGAYLAGLNDAIYKGIADSHGTVWAMNHADKIYHIDLSNFDVANPTITEYDSLHGVPPAWIEPVLIGDEFFFGAQTGVYQFHPEKKEFIRSGSELFRYFNSHKIEAGPIRIDHHGDIWIASEGKAGKLLKTDSLAYAWDSTGTMGIPETSIWSMYFDDSIVWLGTTDFLVKYHPQQKRNGIEKFPAHIRKVISGKDSILFMGAGNSAIKRPELKFRFNDIAFEYASPFFEGENLYSVQLVGNDEDWSPWNRESRIRYTNLSAGDYTFRVKAKNLYAHESSEARYSFTVLPPFYLTKWAYLAYAVLSGFSIWGIVAFNSRRLVRAKKRLEGIVAERTRELSLTNEELKKAKEFEEQFLANMSHEIRTPMNSVVGLTNLMLRTDINPRQQQYLSAIRQSADNMLVILNDILDISKIQSGKLEIDEADFSVREVIAGVLDVMQVPISEKRLRAEADVRPDVPELVNGDSVRLHQIILNLVNNAVKFTEKGSIRISCRVEEKNADFVRLRFKVKDTGMGIPREKLGEIFVNFQQGGKEIARKYGGTGLGLSICKQLVELQHGNISVSSEIGKGTVFAFDIRYGLSALSRTRIEKKPRAEEVQLENLKILLVENNPLHRMVAKDTLEALIKNVQVEVAENGKEAVEMVSGREYDIVLMDLNMPEMDGYEASRKIRGSLPSPKSGVKIIAMSASSTRQEREECRKSGMDDYIAKPFRMEDLLSTLSLHFRPRKKEAKPDGKLTRLSALDEVTGGDDAKKKKYIRMFLDDAPSLLKKLQTALEKDDWKGIRESAHSLIPHFHLLGSPSLKKLAEDIESKAKARGDISGIAAMVNTLDEGIRQSCAELKEEILG